MRYAIKKSIIAPGAQSLVRLGIDFWFKDSSDSPFRSMGLTLTSTCQAVT